MAINLPNGAYTKEFAGRQARLRKHAVDSGLYEGLVAVLHQAGCKSVADLGAGYGQYGVKLSADGFGVFSCDGTPGVSEATGGKVAEKDLSRKQKFGMKWDAVLSVEVGQFVPESRTEDFVGNLARHADKCLVVTWGTPGQRGEGHVNQKTPEEVALLLAKHGFVKNDYLTKLLGRRVVDKRLKKRARVFLQKGIKFSPMAVPRPQMPQRQAMSVRGTSTPQRPPAASSVGDLPRRVGPVAAVARAQPAEPARRSTPKKG